MGCSSSCKIFELLSTGLEWIARNKLGVPHMVHILDDFLTVNRSMNECKASLETFLACCKEIGIPMAPGKKRGASTRAYVCGH